MMAGFPNLFMTTGPNGPAALANIIRISEHDVDWIAAGDGAHGGERAQATMEPTAEAEERWMQRGVLARRAQPRLQGEDLVRRRQRRGQGAGADALYRRVPALSRGGGGGGECGVSDYAFTAATVPA
jgi:hypothetical protein